MTLIKPKRYEDKLVLPKLKKPDIPMTQKEREEYLKHSCWLSYQDGRFML